MILPPGPLEKLTRGCTCWIENRAYRPGRARMLSALAPGGKRELEHDHPGLPVIVTPHVLQGERFYPDAKTRADILVHPARYETFSLAVHEAAASGLPVIATRTNGVEDMVEDGEAGIMIERTVEDVADALIRLSQDPGLRERMGRGRALAFDASRFTGSVLEAYRQLI